MDPDVARMLGELEAKLAEVERALASMAAPAGAPAPPPAGAPQPLAPPLHPLVAASAAAPPGAPAAPATRIVDESTEAHGGPLTSPTAQAPPGPGGAEPQYRDAPALAPRSAQRAARTTTGEAEGRPSPRARALLQFRDRLERAARELTHDYDELLGRLSYAAVPGPPQPTISFARGVPSLDIIDVEGLRDAAVRAFETDPEGTTAYGTSVGYPRLRAWIADRHGVEPERVLLTNGSLQADAFLFDALVGEGDDVVVESPTYDRTLLGLRERGARVHAVRLEQDGIDTDALGLLLAEGVRAKLAHVIPNFQNPAGYTLSLEKRRALVALAAQHDFLVLEDDPYGDLRFSGEPQPTMLSLGGEHVVYASSFTKTVCPGVRVGYLVGPRELIAQIARRATNTYISPGMVSEAIVYEFCASGALERSIETVRTALAERAAALAGALRRELADAEFAEPQGGYFMWVTLPEGTDVHALFEAAAERGVAFVKGTDFMLSGGENTLRLAYSGVTTEQIEAGVARLADAYHSL